MRESEREADHLLACETGPRSSSNPYLVVDKLEWIQCRYLIIQRGITYNPSATGESVSDEPVTSSRGHLTRPIALDPVHPLTINQKAVKIPDLTPKLEAMNRKLANKFEEL